MKLTMHDRQVPDFSMRSIVADIFEAEALLYYSQSRRIQAIARANESLHSTTSILAKAVRSAAGHGLTDEGFKARVMAMDEKLLFDTLREAFFHKGENESSEMPHTLLVLSHSLNIKAYNSHTSSIVFAYALDSMGKRMDALLLRDRMLLAGNYSVFETMPPNGPAYRPRDEAIMQHGWFRQGGFSLLLTEAYKTAAHTAMYKSDFQSALTVYIGALRKLPESADLWNGMGTVQLTMSRTTEAIDSFRRATALDNSPEFLGNLEHALELKLQKRQH